jgi:DNA repair protein RadC
VEELCAVPGIGKATACRIIASATIGKRIMAADVTIAPAFTKPEDIDALFISELKHEMQETFLVLLLNVRNEMIGTEVVSIGNISSTIVDARDVFRPALKRGAAGVVLVHNHPSGNPQPSDADIELTEAICIAGRFLGIKVMDHLIIGNGDYVSMKMENLLPAQ